MAVAYKVLGQAYPAAATTTTVYTVGTATNAVISTVVVCNQTSTSATYRIAVKPTVDTLSTQHYVAYNAAIPALDTVSLTVGMTLGEAENIIVYSSNSSTSFNVFGTEIT
jgi:hypothetical protein